MPTDRGSSENGEAMTIPEYAAMCREKCIVPAQGHDDVPCGGEFTAEDGVTAWGFCGRHWGPLL